MKGAIYQAFAHIDQRNGFRCCIIACKDTHRAKPNVISIYAGIITITLLSVTFHILHVSVLFHSSVRGGFTCIVWVLYIRI
jgi:hypothetical protein